MAQFFVPAIKSEFNYFKKQNLQSSVQESYDREFSPIAPLAPGGQIEFVIEGGADGVYIDLAHSYCYFKVKITQPDGTNRDNNAQAVGPINNLAHSMFQRVEVYLGGKQIGDGAQHYGYRAYLDTALHYGGDANSSWLENQLYIKDTAGQMNTRTFDANGANKGLVARSDYFANNAEVQLIMRPCLDIFNADTILPPNVQLKLRFHPVTHGFVLMTPDATQNVPQVNYQLRITEAKLWIKTLVATPAQELGIKYASRGTKENKRIYIERKALKHVTVTRGQTVVDVDNIYIGEIPKRIVLGFVSDAAMAGSYHLNPFNFHHYNVESLMLYVDGKPLPHKPFTPQFNNNQSLVEYHGLNRALAYDFDNRGVGFNRREFGNGYTVFMFDTTPDIGAKNSISTPRNGSVRLEARFREALNETVNIVLMAAYDAFIEFDDHNNVLVNY